jgi:MSHA pilin protein MshC
VRQLRPAHWPPPGGQCLWAARRGRQRGFTLVELVLVMLLVAVLGALGASRMADREPFALQGAADQLVSGLRLAQATAISQRRSVYVVLTVQPARLDLCLDAACTQPLATPGGDALWLADTDGLRLSAAASFHFAPDGSPSLAQPLQLQVRTDDGARSSPTITVEAVSGHVHRP